MLGLGNQMTNFVFLLKKKKKNKGENMFILTSENYRHQTLSHCLFFFFLLFVFIEHSLKRNHQIIQNVQCPSGSH